MSDNTRAKFGPQIHVVVDHGGGRHPLLHIGNNSVRHPEQHLSRLFHDLLRWQKHIQRIDYIVHSQLEVGGTIVRRYVDRHSDDHRFAGRKDCVGAEPARRIQIASLELQSHLDRNVLGIVGVRW